MAYLDHRITNGYTESLNSVVRATNRADVAMALGQDVVFRRITLAVPSGRAADGAQRS